jgi:hypothetical protein
MISDLRFGMRGDKKTFGLCQYISAIWAIIRTIQGWLSIAKFIRSKNR